MMRQTDITEFCDGGIPVGRAKEAPPSEERFAIAHKENAAQFTTERAYKAFEAQLALKQAKHAARKPDAIRQAERKKRIRCARNFWLHYLRCGFAPPQSWLADLTAANLEAGFKEARASIVPFWLADSVTPFDASKKVTPSHD